MNLRKIHSTDLVTCLNTILGTIKIDIRIQKWILSDAVHIFHGSAHDL